jgi:hypothetical protein
VEHLHRDDEGSSTTGIIPAGDHAMNKHPGQLIDEPHMPALGCDVEITHDQETPEIDLLTPLTIRGVSLRMRESAAANASRVSFSANHILRPAQSCSPRSSRRRG